MHALCDFTHKAASQQHKKDRRVSASENSSFISKEILMEKMKPIVPFLF